LGAPEPLPRSWRGVAVSLILIISRAPGTCTDGKDISRAAYASVC